MNIEVIRTAPGCYDVAVNGRVIGEVWQTRVLRRNPTTNNPYDPYNGRDVWNCAPYPEELQAKTRKEAVAELINFVGSHV